MEDGQKPIENPMDKVPTWRDLHRDTSRSQRRNWARPPQKWSRENTAAQLRARLQTGQTLSEVMKHAMVSP